MRDFFIQNPLFSILLCLFLLEQIMNYFLGSFPYRFGFVVRKIALPNAKQFIETDRQAIDSLSTKSNKSKSEMYLRYRYRFGTAGPILFIGQITLDNGGTTYIRTGVFSSLLILYVFLHSILTAKDPFFSILNIACIIGAIMIFYLMLIRNYQKLTKI
jgi:hypothetical protein